MSEPGNPAADLPGDRPAELQRRIGDAERDRAAGYLQEHMAQGRLDADEFDERVTKALGAKTAADLDPLFTDLPEPRPAALAPQAPFSPPPWSAAGASAVTPAAVPEPPPVVRAPARDDGMPRGAAIALAAVWPAAIIFSFATDFRFWWIWIVAAMVTVFVRRAFPPGSQHRGVDGRDDGPPSLGR